MSKHALNCGVGEGVLGRAAWLEAKEISGEGSMAVDDKTEASWRMLLTGEHRHGRQNGDDLMDAWRRWKMGPRWEMITRISKLLFTCLRKGMYWPHGVQAFFINRNGLFLKYETCMAGSVLKPRLRIQLWA